MITSRRKTDGTATVRGRINAGYPNVATAAIQTIGQLQFVDVVKPDGTTLERRFITVGRLGMPGRGEVLSGLEPGERVVLRPENLQ